MNLDLMFARFDQGSVSRRRCEQFGRIDVLVNNAGVTRDGLALRMKREDWDRVLQINLHGAFLRHAAGAARHDEAALGTDRQYRFGGGRERQRGAGELRGVEGGVIGLTKALAQEMAAREITVNAVAPGFIDTDMTAVLTDELKEKLLAQIPLKRLGRPEEIAAAVRFLASDEAGYITGHVLNVNGGMYM